MSLDDDRLLAMAHGALATGLIGRDHYVPLSERERIAQEVLAAVLPEHERQVRERVAQELLAARAPAPWASEHAPQSDAWIDTRDCTKAVRIARGGS